MNARSRKVRLFLIVDAIFITLLLAAVITLGSLRVPLEPHAWNELVILYALSTFIVAALLVFGLVLSRTLIRLWAERRAEQLGSRFKTKMLFGAMAISLLPLVFLFFISYALMNRTLNRWFPRPLELANSEARKLLGEINHAEYARLAALATRAAAEVSPEEALRPDAAISAAHFAMNQGAEAVWAVDSTGAVVHVSDPLTFPFTQDGTLKYQSELPSGGELWESRSACFLAARTGFGSNYLLVARRLPTDFLARYREIESQTAAYAAENQQIRTFKRQILLTLSLFTLLLLFAATWSALYLAKQVTIPIQALAEATREITAGHLDTQVHVRAQDELGTLVRSFNKMTLQLADSRRQIDEFTHNL
jgi:two-component system nitrogen regulation sensor histidine kinase NtrY